MIFKMGLDGLGYYADTGPDGIEHEPVATGTLTNHLSFDSKGYCVRLSTAKKLFYESQDSDVVCFRSHPNEINADTRSPEETRTARSLVQTSNISFHLPPLAKVTLDQIVQPGDWTAYGKTVPRRLFVMEVTFSF